MQVNLQSPILKESFKYLGWILLFIFLWLNSCSHAEKSTVTATAIVPEVKGQFEVKKVINIPIVIKANLPQLKKGEKIYVENPVDEKLIAENEKLKLDFAKETDSLKKIIAYNKAVQLNKFSSKFEDDNLLLNIDGIVQGEVKEITPRYTIKEKKVGIQVKPKETIFRLLGGLELGNNTKLDNFNIKANLMLQNRKGNIISGSFDTQQNIWMGYNVKIFDIKR
jgi:hypothetical protein